MGEERGSSKRIATYGTSSSFNPERNRIGKVVIVWIKVSDGQTWWQSNVRYLAGGIILLKSARVH